MLSMSIKLNELTGLHYLKDPKKGIHIVSLRTLDKVVLIEVSLAGHGFRMTNAGINRVTSQLLTSIGMWVNNKLRTLQDSNVEEIRVFPSDKKFISRLSRRASSGKFNMFISSITPNGGIKSEARQTQFVHDAGDSFLRFSVPKPLVGIKSKEDYLTEIHKMFNRTA